MSANPIWIAGYFGPVAGAAPVWIAPGDGTVPSAVQSEIVSYYAPVAGATAVWIAGFFAPPPAAIGATPITISGWGGSGGGVAPPPSSVWSAADATAGSMTLSNGGLTVTPQAGANWKTVRATISKTAGKLYFEVVNNVAPTSQFIGIGLADAGFTPVGVNYLGSIAISAGAYLFASQFGAGFTWNYGFPAYNAIVGDVMSVAVDLDAGKGWIAYNNVWQGSGNPASGANPAVTFALLARTTLGLFPGIAMQGEGGTWTLQSTAASQKYAPPSGFSAWDGGAAPPFVFPAANLAALYSLRKAGPGYAGQCLNVRRLSDNATTDIGFGLDGFIDMAAANAFAAGSLLCAVKRYDQSGNGRDWIQLTAANQPQLVALNGRPCIAYTDTGQGQQGWMASASVATMTDMTVGFAGAFCHDLSSILVQQFDGSKGWFLLANGLAGGSNDFGPNPGAFGYWSQSDLEDASHRYLAHANRYVAKRASGIGTVYVNGAQTATGGTATGAAPTTGFAIGGLNPSAGYGFTGFESEVYIYASALSDTDRLAIDANQATAWPDPGFAIPVTGAAGLEFSNISALVLGNVLNYERTNSWTAFVAAKMYAAPIASGFGLFYTNVQPSGAFAGHEFFIRANGCVGGRIINNAATNFLGYTGGTNVCDGKPHKIAYSYDGSSHVAGIRLYVDGVLETLTIESDGLTGSIVAAGQNFYVGNQQVSTQFYLPGVMSFLQVDNVVRNQAYITANFTGAAIPPVDANTDLCLLLNEGAGTTANDTSGHARNGTLTTANQWVP